MRRKAKEICSDSLLFLEIVMKLLVFFQKKFSNALMLFFALLTNHALLSRQD